MNKRYSLSVLLGAVTLALIVSSCGTERRGRYILNPQENLYGERIPAQEDHHISIAVSYFIDPDADMPFEQVMRQDFTPAPDKFNPGFYRGTLYLDVAFSPIPNQEGKDFILWLGHEPLDFAEAFVPQQDDSLKFLGRTGRMILKSQMSLQSWRLAIPFDEYEIQPSTDSDGKQHIIVRTQAYIGAPVNVRIVQNRVFLNQTHRILMRQFLLLGMYILATLFILIYGIARRNTIFTMLGAGAALFVLLILQQKGFGPIYLWNAVSSLPHSPRIVYYLGSATFTLIFIDFVLFAAKYSSLSFPNKTIPLLIILTVSFFALSAIIQSPVAVFIIFSAVSIVISLASCVSLTVMLIRKRRAMAQEFRITTVCWATAALIVFVCQLFRLVRAFRDVPPFTLFDSDRFAMLDIIFMLLIAPALNIAIRQLWSETQETRTQNSFLSREQLLYTEATDELLGMSTVILNTVRLPATSDRESDRKSRALIESASLHATDILNALSVVRTQHVPQDAPIQIVPFFRSCIQTLENYFQQSEELFSLSTNIPEETIVFANENLLEFLFKNFMQAVKKCSIRSYPITVRLLRDNGTFFCIMRTAPAVSPDEQDIQRPAMNLESEVAALYGGTIDIQRQGSDILYTLSVRLTESSGGTVTESEVRRKSRAESAVPQKTDSAEKQARRTGSSILIAEGNVETQRLFRSLLQDGHTLSVCENGIDAWDTLSKQGELPDIIVTEYRLPLLSGDALLTKCREHPRVRNIPVIVLLSAQDASQKAQVLERGAVACLVSPIDANGLIATINAVLSVETMARSSVISDIQEAMSTTIEAPGERPAQETKTQRGPAEEPVLSAREKEIAQLIAQGKSDKEIAGILNISPQTVATHNKKIFKKLDVHSRVELMSKIR